MLNITDLSSIESRVLGWIADCKGINDAFAQGKDTYKIFATIMYHIEYGEVTKQQRNFCKPPVLGCFSKSTRVLTDIGWVSIVDILPEHLLWDGVEFVRHDGVVPQGTKETLTKYGVTATPNHKFHVKGDWIPWENIEKKDLDDGSTNRAMLSEVGEWLSGWENAVGSANAYNAIIRILYTLRTLIVEKPQCVSTALTKNRGLNDLWLLASEYHKQTLTASPIDFTPYASDALLPRTLTTHPMGVGGFLVDLSQLRSSFGTALHSRAGEMQLWKLIDAITTVITAERTFDSLQEQNNVLTLDGLIDLYIEVKRTLLNAFISKSLENTAVALLSLERYEKGVLQNRSSKTNSIAEGSIASRKVYDILNAGPRSRFTISTDHGHAVVHNCGYMLGWKGLIGYAEGMGISVHEEESKKAVNIFRSTWHEIPTFWDWCKHAVFHCTETGGSVEGPHGLSVDAYGEFLFITLPSGRKIAYHQPQILEREAPWYEVEPIIDENGTVIELGVHAIIPQFTFMGKDRYTNKWQRISAHAGFITENIVQALARDILAIWMKRIDEAGYKIVGHVHDEVIVEDDRDAVEELNELIRQPIPWAPGLLLDAEGFTAKRYRKG